MDGNIATGHRQILANMFSIASSPFNMACNIEMINGYTILRYIRASWPTKEKTKPVLISLMHSVSISIPLQLVY